MPLLGFANRAKIQVFIALFESDEGFGGKHRLHITIATCVYAYDRKVNVCMCACAQGSNMLISRCPAHHFHDCLLNGLVRASRLQTRTSKRDCDSNHSFLLLSLANHLHWEPHQETSKEFQMNFKWISYEFLCFAWVVCVCCATRIKQQCGRCCHLANKFNEFVLQVPLASPATPS